MIRILLMTIGGRMSFEDVETVILDTDELIIWNKGKRTKLDPKTCVELQVQFIQPKAVPK